MSGAQPTDLRKLRELLGRRKAVVVLALVITSLVVTGFVWAHKTVQIDADGKTISVRTVSSSPEEILTQAQIYLGNKDEYRLSTTKLVNGTTITVYRAIPVTVTYQEKTQVIMTGKPNVGELVASMGFTEQNSKVSPDRKANLTPMMTINVIGVTEKLEVKKVPAPPPVIRQPDPNLEKDVEEIVEEGREGVIEATVKTRYEDGKEVGSEVVSEKVITPATPQVLRVGTRDTLQTSRGTFRFKQVYTMEATAYNPTDGAPHGLTATGIPARRGIVAVDPDVIPLGTRVYIPGYGLALAADTGGDIVGNRIDLCMEGYTEAWDFGRRMVKVYIIAD